jgi:uncharacterized YigZ family protein
MIDTYLTINEPATARITRKKSRFIGLLYPASREEEAETILAQVKRSYHDATHQCSAYRLMEDFGPIIRTDNAGEPAGSAGRPILQQLEAAELADVLAVVVRYFGGTKLGVGGLIRAYADATKEAIAAATLVEKQQRTRLAIRFPPELSSGVMGLIHRHPIEVKQVSYNKEARILVAVPPSLLARFSQELQEATGARAHIQEEK